MRKTLIIGLDLSFKSTGITINYLEDLHSQKIQFHRILLDKENSSKIYKPKKIVGINDTIYRMPTNLTTDDLLFDINDNNNTKQLDSTLKSLICSKKITTICLQTIEKFNPDELFVSIENYVLPTYSGPTALDNVSGLISLQAYVRKFFIEYKIKTNIPLKLFTETPSSLKLFFTGDGNAEKEFMVGTFINMYDGRKLLPTITVKDTGKINDVIDSFALTAFTYSKIYNN